MVARSGFCNFLVFEGGRWAWYEIVRSSCLKNIPATPCCTPGTDAASPPTPLVTNTVREYNLAMDTIANLTAQEAKREPLIPQLKKPLNNLSKEEQFHVVQKASEDCLLVCSAIAPGSGEELFKSMAQSAREETFEGSPPGDLVVLMTAYKNAKTKNLKKQILSLYAYRYPMSVLQNIHQPYGKLSTWEIRQARSHANLSGPGTIQEVTIKHRVRLDMSKVDHFVEFTNRPYFYQDVSYGSKILILESGDRIEMPNVVRTVTRSTMIEQYMEYCKENCNEPLSRSTLLKFWRSGRHLSVSPSRASTILQLMVRQDFRLLRHWLKLLRKEEWRNSGVLMFVESLEMQNAISRLTSAYIVNHMILPALTTVGILRLVIQLKPTSSNPVNTSTYSVAMTAKG